MDENHTLDVGYLEMHVGERLGSGYSRTVFGMDLPDKTFRGIAIDQ